MRSLATSRPQAAKKVCPSCTRIFRYAEGFCPCAVAAAAAQVIAVEPAEVGPLTGLLAAASASSLAVPLDASLISEVARVPRARAATTARQLAASEGLLVDVAGGAAVAAALDAARQPGREGQTVVVLLPSFGERHLSRCGLCAVRVVVKWRGRVLGGVLISTRSPLPC
eukprot:363764-Chlamydomonas_euryale.AAC.2